MADTPLPFLYSFRRCPYAMRGRLALHISATQCEVREIILRDKPQAMLDASPKGTVPVLVLPDGSVLEESLDIMHWALGRNDPEGWLEGEETELIATNDGPFKHHLDRYKYATRHDSDPEEHRAAAQDILMRLEERLSRSAYLCGDQRRMTDCAIFPFIRQFAATDREWFDAQDWPHLKAWLDGLLASPLFKAVMVKRPLWEVGTEGEKLF
ncbi:glutathione S-transferase [Altericroceibacterium endophyticum]|uniref:Glutathione S-transferase n=1 Tax=Altericroceibacterium endophyticum TaxID=1808508 RepID=A0A6I4T4F5_9SPHN|nr:glutathione S-transferase [Altericroceibacterium endophyticum]MXO65031.1 glutathione S-transferase [Altericroceibacterium endophyticum]